MRAGRGGAERCRRGKGARGKARGKGQGARGKGGTQPPPPPLGPPPSYTPYDGDAIEGFVEALRQSI